MDDIIGSNNSVTASVEIPGFINSEVLDVCVRPSVRGTDDEGNTSAEECIYLPVYDPSAGFVTGVGWIWSPQGAYVADTSLEGKANFGFVAKYKKGQTEPDGNTEFQFKAADLNFNSVSYEWLVVAGPNAKFKGTGTINGEGAYKFMITASDGDLKNNGEPDSFRIRIWEADENGTGISVYDNQIGEDVNGYATTELGGGSIIIHDNKGK